MRKLFNLELHMKLCECMFMSDFQIQNFRFHSDLQLLIVYQCQFSTIKSVLTNTTRLWFLKNISILNNTDNLTSFSRFRYNIVFLILTYAIPIVVMIFCYSLMGRELWGSRSIGEHTERQLESMRSKRKV